MRYGIIVGILFGRCNSTSANGDRQVGKINLISLWDGLIMTFLVLYSIILAYKGLSKAEKQNKGNLYIWS